MNDATHLCRSVLIESMQVLGAFKNGLIVVGGWVPEITFPELGHIGSMDVDYALDPRYVPPYVYDTIRNRLLKAGYRQVRTDSVFLRDLGGSVPIKIDLITGSTGTTSVAQPIQGMMISELRGVELAFDNWVEKEIHGQLPDGTDNTVSAKVATIEASLLMKALALGERLKEKDAYDIYFYLVHVPGGPLANSSMAETDKLG